MFSGPTNFAPTINKINAIARQSTIINYYILLIITDGQICDEDDTVNAVVESSYLPVSIIIVGVGNASFDAMNILDADDDRLVSKNGKKQIRDNVQFVPFNECKNDGYILKKKVLEEIPDQIEEYCKINNIKTIQLNNTSQTSSIMIPNY